MNALDSATDRFFRAFYDHCVSSDEDTLFNLLNALHSFHDKLCKATDQNLFGSRNFLALKALRNFFHHKGELLQEIKVVAANGPLIVTDLLFVCLLDRDLAIQAIDEDLAKAGRHRKKGDRDEILGAFKWYGLVANIQPCLFNCAVDVFEAIQLSAIKPSSEAYSSFEVEYCREEESGRPHRVSGDISSHAGDVEQILREVFRSKRPA